MSKNRRTAIINEVVTAINHPTYATIIDTSTTLRSVRFDVRMRSDGNGVRCVVIALESEEQAR
tara:strand:- start:94 stop:282 length:189 start_codon:yes stop_codon:yes gene_type:complete